ncbi:hypothetical protein RM704_23500 [Streptomyces sp. DSM 3412]|uniref:VCBS repeat-containing protein n=1 Tax=Streptomyces gottesmaniae TaxID=3075518 RepID=A0ABU2Z297_9ACTN|nr:hypothetical protein [Streptomyces sp. DSM 3412]MDT0570394.1 hypothetical protein [Streptomyces sp. DSM 3412]
MFGSAILLRDLDGTGDRDLLAASANGMTSLPPVPPPWGASRPALGWIVTNSRD